MGKRGIKNISLLALVLLLLLFVWFSKNGEEQNQYTPLTPLDPATVKLIRISNNNGPAFTIERHNDNWQMTTPHAIAANQPRVNILLDLVSTPTLEQQPLPVERLEEFGLKQPVAEVQFDQTKIIFGGTHPYNYRRYLRIGDTLHLTDDLFPHHALARPEAFISHALFSQEQKVVAIETAEWHLSRNSDQVLQLDPPQPGISTDLLVGKIDQWQNTWVERIEQAPETTTSETVKIWLKGSSEPVTLAILREKKSILLISPARGLAYRLPEETELLLIPAGK